MAEPARVREIGRIGKIGTASIILSLCVFSLVALVWWAVLTGKVSRPLGMLAMIPLAYAAFTPMHEAAHGNIGGRRSRRWLDAVFGWGCSLILFAPLPLFRAGHLSHHAHVNHRDRDPDTWVAREGVLATLAGCFTFLPRYYWNFFRGTCPDRSKRGERAAIYLGMIVIAAISTALFLAGLGWAFAWLWLYPAACTGGLLALAFAWLPHVPHEDTGRWTNARMYPFAVLTFPLMVHNYHLIHHLWPRVPFNLYPTVYAHRLDLLHAHGVRILGPDKQRRAAASGDRSV